MRGFLETERLVLRRFAEADVDDLYALHNDADVMRFLNGGKPASREEIEREYHERFADDGYWAAIEKTAGEFLGWFALHPTGDGDPDEVELGYRLKRAAWGKGYATEGSRALIRKGFTGLGVRRVWAQTMAVNLASRRVMEKAGLGYVRTVHLEWEDPLPGTEQGEVEYALTRADWERRETNIEQVGKRAPVDVREGWNRTFARLDEDHGGEDAWLERWLDLLESGRDSPILDLGCGAGQDARFLTQRGFAVVAADFSKKALEITRRRAPDAEVRNVDLARPLPFPEASFGTIVASLSLHYFPLRQTLEILGEVRRCLTPGGHLLARLNSTRDAHHAAADKEEIEPNFYLVNGHPKRLFDHDSVLALFRTGWEVLDHSERTTKRYGSPKTLWEVAARKAES